MRIHSMGGTVRELKCHPSTSFHIFLNSTPTKKHSPKIVLNKSETPNNFLPSNFINISNVYTSELTATTLHSFLLEK